MYLVMKLVKEFTVEVLGHKTKLDLTEKNIKGYLPVFRTKTAARKIYGKDVELLEVKSER